MIADIFTVKAQCLDPATTVLALERGACPLCSGRLLIHVGRDRRAIPSSAIGGYCTACDVTEYTVINLAGKRRCLMKFRVLADGNLRGRQTLMWELTEDHERQLSAAHHPAGKKQVAPVCTHAGNLTAECEGWENPTEPLSIRVTCGSCDRHLTITIQDPSLIDWEQD